MSTISSLGVGSGIDIRSLVDDLVAAERAPQQTRIDNNRERAETSLSGLGQVRSALNTFQEVVNATASGFNTTTATSSNPAVSISAQNNAPSANAEIEVEALARAQSLAISPGVATRTEPLGTGTLTFNFGAVTTDVQGNVTDQTLNGARGSVDITIDASNNSLDGIRKAVNAADIGIRATIVNDGAGDRLVFASTKTGAENGFTIDVAGADAGALENFAFNQTTANAELSRAGSDARLRIDGLEITRPSNTITDLLEGATITLNSLTSGSPAQVAVQDDPNAAREAIEAFVKGFNDLQKELNRLTKFNPETLEAGPLNGNALVRNLTSQIRNQLTAPLEALQGRSVRATADVGILTNRDGTLQLDKTRLESALARDPQAVQALFTQTGLVEGSGFQLANARSSANGGQFQVEVTQAASRGKALVAAPADPPSIQDGMGFRINVNGVQSNSILLAQQDFATMEDFARELEARINGDSNLRTANAQVRVEVTGGEIQFRSARFGSDSSIGFSNVVGGFENVLDVANATKTTGTDVQGNIGGRPAIGEGLRLTSNEGPATGLGINIDPGVTGNLGTLSFSKGVGSNISKLLDSYLGSRGLLNNITSNLDNTLKRLNSDTERLDKRMSSIEARYLREFSAMDAMVAQMNQTSEFLTQQLDALNNNKKR